MKQPMISIIVPIYKVEAYLEKCVESLRQQTYKNLEIILVDDGSPDNCGKMCDSYAKADDRIKVIHQTNAGPSAARNAALHIVKGEYIGFVDSDDYIDKDMYEYLYQLIVDYKADISICEFRKFSEDGDILSKEQQEVKKIYDNKEVMKALIDDEIISSQPCNKLFKKNMFENMEYPVGRVYEDIAIMHYVFAKARRVVYSSVMKYNYLIRGNSTSYTQNAAWGYGLFSAFRDRYLFINEKYPELRDKAKEKLIGIATGVFIHWKHFEETEEIIRWQEEVRAQLKENRKYILKCRNMSVQRRMDALFITSIPSLVKMKYMLYYKIRRR